MSNLTPVPDPQKPFGNKFTKVLWGIAAAFTTPEAIKAEKSLAAVALTRAAVLIPSAAFVIDLAVKALGG
jgi:hypothetical protein